MGNWTGRTQAAQPRQAVEFAISIQKVFANGLRLHLKILFLSGFQQLLIDFQMNEKTYSVYSVF
jgi:hypothetical protein